MIAANKGFVRRAGLVLAVSLPLISTQAHAVTVTVGGVSYELSNVAGSFDSINSTNPTLLSSQPWWQTSTGGGREVALEFARKYSESPGVAAGEIRLFAYDLSDNVQDNVQLAYALPPGYYDAAQLNSDLSFYGYMTATASASSVPEINAGSLSQAMLILFALWLVTWRRSASRVA